MDIVFLDTSIFESNNFLEGKRIKEVFKLSERGDIKVVLPKLTYDEIINRISNKIDEVDSRIQKFRNDIRILRNIPSFSNRFESFDNEQVKNELKEIINRTFLESKIEILDYPTLNIEQIFKSYFDKKFPFGNGGKKSEFPDAFILKSIEIWAEENGVKVLVFSKDNDILKYKNIHLVIVEDFDAYLSDKIKEVEGVKHKKRLEQIDYIINNKSERIQEEIKNWIEEQLDDDSKYDGYSNYYDIHDVRIIEINTDFEDYKITNVSEEYISVELQVWINYKVEIIIDDEEYMYKDEDTRGWVFPETKPLLVNEIRNIDVELIFDIDSDNNTVYQPEIETINNGRILNV